MSQQLSFTITASDQASKVVDQVKKKVQDMGKDIGKSIASFVGPTALVTGAISLISSKIEEMKQKTKDAFDWGSGLRDSAAALDVGVEEFQKLEYIATVSGQSVGNVGKAFKLSADLIAKAKGGNLEAAESLETLGFKLTELEDLKPEDVVKALGDAMASIQNPIDKAAAAFAAFGDEGKALIQTLERIRGLAKGPAPEGLTQEEADFLAEIKRQEEIAANQERLRNARKTATERFLSQTPEGQAIVEREKEKILRAGPMGQAGAVLLNPSTLSDSQRIQNEVQGILAAQARSRAAANAPTPQAISAGEAAVQLGTKRREKTEKEAKEKEEKDKEKAKEAAKPDKIKAEAFKAPTLTVSSLREIGGGMAGELSISEKMAQEQLDYARRTAEALEKIIQSQQPITDFTKPAPEGLVPNFGRRGTMVA